MRADPLTTGTAPPRLLDRAEIRLGAAFWVVSGTTALLRGTFVSWLPYALPVAGVFLLWPFVARRRGAGAVLDWLPFPLVLVTYDMLHEVVGRTWPWTIDPALRAVDRAVLGADAARLLEPLVHPWATVFFAACYASYYVAPLSLGIWWFARGRRQAFRELMVGEAGLLFVGYLGYLFLPAEGPHVFLSHADLGVPLVGDFAGPAIRSRAHLHGGIQPRDAFPSLHTANAVTLLLMLVRHERRLLRVYLVPMLGLVAATVYLRFHYVVDVVAGAALALAWQPAAIALVRRERDPVVN